MEASHTKITQDNALSLYYLASRMGDSSFLLSFVGSTSSAWPLNIKEPQNLVLIITEFLFISIYTNFFGNLYQSHILKIFYILLTPIFTSLALTSPLDFGLSTSNCLLNIFHLNI